MGHDSSVFDFNHKSYGPIVGYSLLHASQSELQTTFNIFIRSLKALGELLFNNIHVGIHVGHIYLSNKQLS